MSLDITRVLEQASHLRWLDYQSTYPLIGMRDRSWWEILDSMALESFAVYREFALACGHESDDLMRLAEQIRDNEASRLVKRIGGQFRAADREVAA